MAVQFSGGLWPASASASGLQVIDRLIRASPCLWPYVVLNEPVQNEPVQNDAWAQSCSDIATVAECAMASPCSPQLVEGRVLLIRKWRSQTARLLTDPGIPQRTDAWHLARTQLTTASDVSAAIGGRHGSTKEFLVKKAGGPEEQRAFSGSAPPLKWGIMFEPVASAIYARRLGVRVHEFGLLRHPTIAHIGASPDGITDMGVMLEIKCPFSRVIDGSVPAAYIAQIQCQLDVCGLDECDFFECSFEETGPCDLQDLQDFQDLQDGREHGVLVEHWSECSGTHVYHYCPDMGGCTQIETATREAWAEAVAQRLRDQGLDPLIRRWRLKALDIVRVHRDPSYIASMNASLEVAWARVLRYRTDRDAYRTEVVLGRRPSHASATVATSLQGYAFVEDAE